MSDLPPLSGPEGGAGGLNPPAAPSSPYTPPIESPYTPPIGEPFGRAEGYMPSSPNMREATFGQRFGALFVDSIITMLFFVPGFIAGGSGGTETFQCDKRSRREQRRRLHL